MSTGKLQHQRGLSLVELMVALVISLVLIGGVIQIYLSSQQSFRAQENLARMQETGRYVTDLIVADLRRAGYWGGNADVTTISGNPGPADWTNICPDNDAWPRMIERRVFGDSSFGCLSATADSDALTVRFSDSNAVNEMNLESGVRYISSNLFEGRLLNGQSGPVGGANALDPLGSDEILYRRLHARVYFVRDVQNADTACRGDQTVPALFRSTGAETDALALGVEHMRFQFLEEGRDRYVDSDGVIDWADVIAVRTWILVRSECAERGLGARTEFNIAGETYEAQGDNAADFRRHLYVNTVQLRNL